MNAARSKASGVLLVPVKPGSTQYWKLRRWGILAGCKAPRFCMPDWLCIFRMVTARAGSVSFSSVAGCSNRSSLPLSLCSARRRGKNAFRVLRLLSFPRVWDWAPVPPDSALCVIVVSGPSKGLNFFFKASLMWSARPVRIAVSVNARMEPVAFGPSKSAIRHWGSVVPLYLGS